jgi:hypothetical protein
MGSFLLLWAPPVDFLTLANHQPQPTLQQISNLNLHHPNSQSSPTITATNQQQKPPPHSNNHISFAIAATNQQQKLPPHSNSYLTNRNTSAPKASTPFKQPHLTFHHRNKPTTKKLNPSQNRSNPQLPQTIYNQLVTLVIFLIVAARMLVFITSAVS